MDGSKLVFCTLFDSGYVDKGLVLYKSLCKNAKNFRLYVFAFDEKCYEIMSEYADESLTVVSLADFESEDLLKAKQNRNAREYCWTCSSHTIKYVLEHYKEPHCTYIDADMYFYKDPGCLLQEIEESRCDVSIIRHGFIPNKENMRHINMSGEYCVEFNTFYNTDNGWKVLDWWCGQCLECCPDKADGIRLGDQKYLEQFQKLFTGVHVLQNKGAGVAPWNIARFELYGDGVDDHIELREKTTKEIFPLIFYHFQKIRYLSEKSADINVYIYPHKASKKIRNRIYLPYMYKISKERQELAEKYNLLLDQKELYIKKQSFVEFTKSLIKNERNLLIGIRRFCRALFLKKYDYISW